MTNLCDQCKKCGLVTRRFFSLIVISDGTGRENDMSGFDRSCSFVEVAGVKQSNTPQGVPSTC